MPIDVAMEEPGARIVREEADRDVIPSIPDAHNIPDNRVVEVVRRIASAADHMEVVPMQMNRMLLCGQSRQIDNILGQTLRYSQVRQRRHQE
jgi:hypothetical protein